MKSKSIYDADPIYVIAKTEGPTRYLRIEAGCGDNLLREDYEAGYVDYANYCIADAPEDVREFHDYNADGGMWMTTSMIQNFKHGLTELAPDILDGENVEPIAICVYADEETFFAAANKNL